MALRIKGERPLKTLDGLNTRPTSSKVRAAVFNILQDRVNDAHWLDLCAGSGAMGAEALARGARSVTGVEQSAAACRIIKENWQQICDATQTHQVIRGDVVKILAKLAPQKFDFIYFDPPYQSDLYAPVLAVVGSLLRSDGIVIAEHDRNRHLPDQPALDLIAYDRRQYGQTALCFYRLATEDHNQSIE
ncbi:MAG: 16S rRNA (guanine(966)-N(2))-methyltransferase RsmD [Pseudanabaena sp. ELA607]